MAELREGSAGYQGCCAEPPWLLGARSVPEDVQSGRRDAATEFQRFHV